MNHEVAAPIDWRALPPLSVEGLALSHTMLRLDAKAMRADDPDELKLAAQEFVRRFLPDESAGRTALYCVNGSADLLLLHARADVAALQSLDEQLPSLSLSRYARRVDGFLSVIEMSLHDATVELYSRLADEGSTPHDERWRAACAALRDKHQALLSERLRPRLPESGWLCFYPMSRRGAGADNWRLLPLDERARLMREHGATGRRWAGRVRQIISGATAFSDHEWGVDLFAEDPLLFKQIVQEMRFDVVSARYSDFGSFVVARRLPLGDFAAWLGER